MDVVVIGGGAIGLAIAWRAALAGMTVSVFDDSPGRGASWVAAGLLAPVTEAHFGEEALLRLNLASAQLYPAFAAELEDAAGLGVGYRETGMLMVARDADDIAAFAELTTFHERLGLAIERLDRRSCRSLEPALAPSIRGGVWVAGDHQVDPRALTAALAEASRARGVRLVPERVEAIEVEGERVAAVRSSGGDRIACGAAVLAAGAWSGAIAGVPPEVRVRPVKGQLLNLRGDAALARHNLRGLDVYIVPRSDGRLVVGATVEERGFDTSVTAGAVYTLLRDAYELLPGITELELAEAIAAARPGTPDNAPLIGRCSVDGLVCATGHYRNGILLAPLTAAAVTDVLTTGEAPHDVVPFSPLRFVPDRAA